MAQNDSDDATVTLQNPSDRVPTSNSRGPTPESSFLSAFFTETGDSVFLTVEAESSGDLPECEDREEEWTGEVEEVRYDSRKNLYALVGEFERVGGDESGQGYVRFHTRKNPEKGLSFGENSNGSPMRFDAPVDIFSDDRERTVTLFE